MKVTWNDPKDVTPEELREVEDILLDSLSLHVPMMLMNMSYHNIWAGNKYVQFSDFTDEFKQRLVMSFQKRIKQRPLGDLYERVRNLEDNLARWESKVVSLMDTPALDESEVQDSFREIVSWKPKEYGPHDDF